MWGGTQKFFWDDYFNQLHKVESLRHNSLSVLMPKIVVWTMSRRSDLSCSVLSGSVGCNSNDDSSSLSGSALSPCRCKFEFFAQIESAKQAFD